MHKGITNFPMLLLRNEQTHKIDCPTECPEPDPWLCNETSSGASYCQMPIAQCNIYARAFPRPETVERRIVPLVFSGRLLTTYLR